jgi:hypothetical protein
MMLDGWLKEPSPWWSAVTPPPIFVCIQYALLLKTFSEMIPFYIVSIPFLNVSPQSRDCHMVSVVLLEFGCNFGYK